MKQEKVYVEGYVVGFMVVPTGNVEKQIQVSSGEYEVEKERRYLVTLKNGQPLVKSQPGNTLYFNQNITAGNYKASRKELEEAGFGWVFDCPGIEIEKVQEGGQQMKVDLSNNTIYDIVYADPPWPKKRVD